MTALLQPDFPPLLSGVSVGRGDPFAEALKLVRGGEVVPGLLHYAETGERMEAAVTLAPEEPLERAMAGIIAAELGLMDALGSLAPPEVAVQLRWPGILLVNGGRCGAFRAAASTREPGVEPDWLVIGAAVRLASDPDAEPGADPGATALHEEGCAEIAAPALIEAFGRHLLVWIDTYLNDGMAPLHAAWSGKVDGIGGDVTSPQAGNFVGLDERGGMQLRQGQATRLLPLTEMLEDI